MHQIEVVNELGVVKQYIELNTSRSSALFLKGDVLRLSTGLYKVIEVAHNFVCNPPEYAYTSYISIEL